MSVAPLRRSRTTISVERPDILRSLVNSDRPVSCSVVSRLLGDSRAARRTLGNRNNSNVSNAGSQHSSFIPDEELVNSTSYHNWLCPESIHKVQSESDPDCRETTQMCDSILDAENQYTEDVSDFLCDQDMLDLRRRELLHREWTDRVYNPIREEVEAEINGKNFARLAYHKRQLFEEFLEHCNRNGQIFLNSSGETRGANFRLKPLHLTANTGPLADPLLLQRRVFNAEEGVAARCDTGRRLSTAEIERLRLPTVRLNPPGRHEMKWLDWQIMYVNQIESPARQRQRLKMRPNKLHSRLTWANYFTPCEPEVVDEEMCLRKGEVYHRPRVPPPPPPEQEIIAAAL